MAGSGSGMCAARASPGSSLHYWSETKRVQQRLEDGGSALERMRSLKKYARRRRYTKRIGNLVSSWLGETFWRRGQKLDWAGRLTGTGDQGPTKPPGIVQRVQNSPSTRVSRCRKGFRVAKSMGGRRKALRELMGGCSNSMGEVCPPVSLSAAWRVEIGAPAHGVQSTAYSGAHAQGLWHVLTARSSHIPSTHHATRGCRLAIETVLEPWEERQENNAQSNPSYESVAALWSLLLTHEGSHVMTSTQCITSYTGESRAL